MVTSLTLFYHFVKTLVCWTWSYWIIY